jgi:hypothetical protein
VTDLATVAATFLSGGVVVFLVDRAWTAATNRREHKKRFRAAALLVSDELRANVVRLEVAYEAARAGAPEEIDLASQTYQEHQLLLAQYLDPETRDAVRGAYVFARVPRALQRVKWLSETERSVQVIAVLADEALRRARTARERLANYIPPGSAEI